MASSFAFAVSPSGRNGMTVRLESDDTALWKAILTALDSMAAAGNTQAAIDAGNVRKIASDIGVVLETK